MSTSGISPFHPPARPFNQMHTNWPVCYVPAICRTSSERATRRFKWILMSSKRKSGIVDGPDSFLSFVQLLSEVRYIHAKLRRPYGEAVLSITFKTRFRVGLRNRIIKQFHCLTCFADTKPTIGRSWANAHAIFPNLCCLLVVKPSPRPLFLLLPSAINLWIWEFFNGTRMIYAAKTGDTAHSPWQLWVSPLRIAAEPNPTTTHNTT